MKIIRSTPNEKTGRIRLVVELDPNEELIAVSDDGFYKLGYPMDDTVVQSHLITGAKRVTWCPITQEFIS